MGDGAADGAGEGETRVKVDAGQLLGLGGLGPEGRGGSTHLAGGVVRRRD